MPMHSHVNKEAFLLAGRRKRVPAHSRLHRHTRRSAPSGTSIYNSRGMTLSAPLLPGHGTRWEDMNEASWHDHLCLVEHAYARLASEHEHVFVGGLSMGALLALALGHAHPKIAGLLVYSPALRAANKLLPLTILMRRFIPSVAKRGASDLFDPSAEDRLWHYDRDPVGGASQLWLLQRHVHAILPAVRPPALVVYSSGDRAIHPDSAPEVIRHIGSDDLAVLHLHGSGHNLLVDAERKVIFHRTDQFINRVLDNSK